MNKFLSYGVFAFTVLLSSCDSQPKQEPLADVIDRGLKASTEQALLSLRCDMSEILFVSRFSFRNAVSFSIGDKS